jgi:hypothetical protein
MEVSYRVVGIEVYCLLVARSCLFIVAYFDKVVTVVDRVTVRIRLQVPQNAQGNDRYDGQQSVVISQTDLNQRNRLTLMWLGVSAVPCELSSSPEINPADIG